MTWFGYVLVALFVVGALTTVVNIGKPKPAITSGTASVVIVLNSLLVWGLLAVGV